MGKINPELLARRQAAAPNDPHGGAESRERWERAAAHPDAQDLQAAQELVSRMEHKLALREKYLAKQAAKMTK
jgi:hypothetical protein